MIGRRRAFETFELKIPSEPVTGTISSVASQMRKESLAREGSEKRIHVVSPWYTADGRGAAEGRATRATTTLSAFVCQITFIDIVVILIVGK